MFWVFIPEKLIRIMDLLKKKKKNLAHRLLLKWLKRPVLARNTSHPQIHTSECCFSSLFTAGWWGPFPSVSTTSVQSMLRMALGKVTRGCWLYSPPHLNPNNTFIQQMDERYFMAVAEAHPWSNWKSLQGLIWESFWWKNSNLWVQPKT